MDFTGDIETVENIDFFSRKSQEMGNIDLAFSIDCPLVDLEYDYRIRFAGIVASLKALSKGGNAVILLGHNNLFYSRYISLMYFLVLAFEKVHILNPATHPYTLTECFVVAMNFQKSDIIEQYIETMKLKVDLDSWESGPLFPQDIIPKDFLVQINQCANLITNGLISDIKLVLLYYEKPENEISKKRKFILRTIPQKFMKKFKIKEIAKEKYLIQDINLLKAVNRTKESLDLQFCRNQQCNLTAETLSVLHKFKRFEKLQLIFKTFTNIQELVEWPYEVEETSILNLNPVELCLEYGKPIDRILKTMFVCPASMFFYAFLIEEECKASLFSSFPKGEVSCVFDDSVSIIYEYQKHFGNAEKTFFFSIFEKWIELKPKKVYFKNVLFLTHFSVSFLRILAQFYESIKVNMNGIIILENLLPQNVDSNLIDDLKNHFEKSLDFIMCLINLKILKEGKFFELILNYNSQLIKHYVVELVQKFVALFDKS